MGEPESEGSWNRPLFARISTAAFHEYPSSIEEMEFNDARRDPKCCHGRWLAERGGEAVGYGEYGQRSSSYHPRRFLRQIIVAPVEKGVWMSALLKNPGLVRGACSFGVKDGEYIGATMLRSSQSDNEATTT